MINEHNKFWIEKKLTWKIEDKILDVANLYNDVTTSDLQAIATVQADKIIELVKKEVIKKPR